MRFPILELLCIFALSLIVISAPRAVAEPAIDNSTGTWTFDIEDRGHPTLQYIVAGKTVFFVGCGRAFGLHAIYPITARNVGDNVTITVANSKTSMTFSGQIDESWESDPPNTKHFRQWDLGYDRQDPELYGRKWKMREIRFLNLLDSGVPLTISAEHANYLMPAVNVPKWKVLFLKKC